VCACHRQKIEFEFKPFTHRQFFANTTQTLTLSQFDIVTEEISPLGADERLYTMNHQGPLGDGRGEETPRHRHGPESKFH
jgi:hypothetical protein